MDYKFLVVKENVTELENLINQKGWEVKTAFTHPKGVLIGLVRRKQLKLRK